MTHDPAAAATQRPSTDDATTAARPAPVVPDDRYRPADRLKAFVDAVVAIAMTLLVLPLVDAVIQSPGRDESTAHILGGLGPMIVAFVMSFLIIAMSWSAHHELFASIERVDRTVVWLTYLWMLLIVWMPVPTALVYTSPADWLQKVLYVGTLFATSLLVLLTRWQVRDAPGLSSVPRRELTGSLVAGTISCAMYLVAMGVVVAIPGSEGYFGLFVLMLLGPIVRWARARVARAQGLDPDDSRARSAR